MCDNDEKSDYKSIQPHADDKNKTLNMLNIDFDEISSPVDYKPRGQLFNMYKEGKFDGNILHTERPNKVYKLTNKVDENNLDTEIKPFILPINDIPNATVVAKPVNIANLLINNRQRKNDLIEKIKNVRWEFADIEPDFIMARNRCALFLSLRYHNTKPNYIYERIRDLKSSFELRVLLVLVDMKDCNYMIRELTKTCITHNLTMLLSWSNEEVARYLESYKAFENKSPDLLMGEKLKLDGYEEKSAREEEINGIVGFLSSVISVNKTDARTLIETFGTIEAIMKADLEQLKACPGLGDLKARHLHDLFRRPLLKKSSQLTDSDDDEDVNK